MELGHSDLLSAYKTDFAQMSLSQENAIDSGQIWSEMVLEWNYFNFVPVDYPRWPPRGPLLKIAQT